MTFPALRFAVHNPRLVREAGGWWLLDDTKGYRAKLDLTTLSRLNQEAAMAVFVNHLAETEKPHGPQEIPFGED